MVDIAERSETGSIRKDHEMMNDMKKKQIDRLEPSQRSEM